MVFVLAYHDRRFFAFQDPNSIADSRDIRNGENTQGSNSIHNNKDNNDPQQNAFIQKPNLQNKGKDSLDSKDSNIQVQNKEIPQMGHEEKPKARQVKDVKFEEEEKAAFNPDGVKPVDPNAPGMKTDLFSFFLNDSFDMFIGTWILWIYLISSLQIVLTTKKEKNHQNFSLCQFLTQRKLLLPNNNNDAIKTNCIKAKLIMCTKELQV